MYLDSFFLDLTSVLSDYFQIYFDALYSALFKVIPLETKVYPCVLQNTIPHNDTQKTYILTYLLTYPMVQILSWEANWFVASQEIPRISRKKTNIVY